MDIEKKVSLDEIKIMITQLYISLSLLRKDFMDFPVITDVIDITKKNLFLLERYITPENTKKNVEKVLE